MFTNHPKIKINLIAPFMVFFNVSILFTACTSEKEVPKEIMNPNIILIITDDQGYGDLGFFGNPVIKTPTLDSLARNSTRLSQFYVSPVCAPTRSSLMTGRYSIRTGVYDTYNGGAIMSTDEKTIAEYLGESGYITGIFGKWHLGDTYPFRPMDQGFDVSLVHGGGGIGQPGDFYENYIKGDSSYFNPTLRLNGIKIQTRGYCSDVYTDHAIRFIEENVDNSFFLYLSYNAPHTPLQLPEEYYERYKNVPKELFLTDTLDGRNMLQDYWIEEAKRVYGMVSNIDDNLSRLFNILHSLKIENKTLVIFITDNGPQGNRYNAGLRSRKGSVYEGGIRVPSFWSWPGQINQDFDINVVTAHIDILPTILEICDIKPSSQNPLDGRSLWPLLNGEDEDFPDRDLIFHWIRGFPEPYHNIAVRSGNYKLVGNGSYLVPDNTFELFDIKSDPYELNDISGESPDMINALKGKFDDWYHDAINNEHLKPQRIIIGSEYENPVILNRNDTKGPMVKNWMSPTAIGYWDVSIASDGFYDVSMRFFRRLGPGMATFRVGTVQRTVRNLSDSTDMVSLHNINLLKGDYMLEGWYQYNSELYAPIYIEIAKNNKL